MARSIASRRCTNGMDATAATASVIFVELFHDECTARELSQLLHAKLRVGERGSSLTQVRNAFLEALERFREVELLRLQLLDDGLDSLEPFLECHCTSPLRVALA